MIIQDVNVVFPLMIIFAGLAVVRTRAMGRRQGKLQQEIAVLRAAQAAPVQRRDPTTDQVQMLEDRVRVLERIVTDQNHSLARDIEALRDAPRTIEQGSVF